MRTKEWKGEVSVWQKGRTCVGSLARANVQRSQAKEAEKQKQVGHGGTVEIVIMHNPIRKF